MDMTLCDRCPRTHPLVTAHYRVSFQRLDGGAHPDADRPMDLCQSHYNEMWEKWAD